MEQTLRQKQIKEALERMKILKLMSQVREDFKKEQKVYYSERQNAMFNAVLYWLDNEPQYMDIVKKFEKKYKALVYHCQLTHTMMGDLLSIMYVSKNEDEWEDDKEDLRNGIAFARVENLKCDYDSDFGTIGIKPSMGGVLRTA